MKHKIILSLLGALTLTGAILLPEWLERSNSAEPAVTDSPVDESEVPVEIIIPIVSYEEAVGDPLLPEPMTLAQVANQRESALTVSVTVSESSAHNQSDGGIVASTISISSSADTASLSQGTTNN